MGSDTTTDLQVFQKKVRALKLTDSNSAYESVRKHLELSLGDDSNIHIKALLIKVTHICYPNRKIEADAVLAALGLLEGYNNYGNDFNLEKGVDAAKFLLTERCKKFLRESIYLDIVKVQGRFYYSYKELESAEYPNPGCKKNPLDTALGTLEKRIDGYLDEISKTLYESSAKQLNEYMIKSEIHIDKSGKKLNLQPLENKREKYFAADSSTKVAISLRQGREYEKKENDVIATTFVVPDEDAPDGRITVSITGHKTSKTRKLLQEAIELIFLGIVMAVLTTVHIQNYDVLTRKYAEVEQLGNNDIEIPRDPDKLCVYYIWLIIYVIIIIICIIATAVMLYMIIKRNKLIESLKKNE